MVRLTRAEYDEALAQRLAALLLAEWRRYMQAERSAACPRDDDALRAWVDQKVAEDVEQRAIR